MTGEDLSSTDIHLACRDTLLVGQVAEMSQIDPSDTEYSHRVHNRKLQARFFFLSKIQKRRFYLTKFVLGVIIAFILCQLTIKVRSHLEIALIGITVTEVFISTVPIALANLYAQIDTDW